MKKPHSGTHTRPFFFFSLSLSLSLSLSGSSVSRLCDDGLMCPKISRACQVAALVRAARVSAPAREDARGSYEPAREDARRLYEREEHVRRSYEEAASPPAVRSSFGSSWAAVLDERRPEALFGVGTHKRYPLSSCRATYSLSLLRVVRSEDFLRERKKNTRAPSLAPFAATRRGVRAPSL